MVLLQINLVGNNLRKLRELKIFLHAVPKTFTKTMHVLFTMAGKLKKLNSQHDPVLIDSDDDEVNDESTKELGSYKDLNTNANMLV